MTDTLTEHEREAARRRAEKARRKARLARERQAALHAREHDASGRRLEPRDTGTLPGEDTPIPKHPREAKLFRLLQRDAIVWHRRGAEHNFCPPWNGRYRGYVLNDDGDGE